MSKRLGLLANNIERRVKFESGRGPLLEDAYDFAINNHDHFVQDSNIHSSELSSFVRNDVVIVDDSFINDLDLSPTTYSTESSSSTAKKGSIEAGADEKLLRRRRLAAEAKRRRRQNETPEQREKRLRQHADRMRRNRSKTQQQSYPKEYLGEYEVDQTAGNSQGHAYGQGEPMQIVAMPQHQAVYHQPTSAAQYRQGHQQPTIITVPIPVSTTGSGPLTIHVTLPEHMQLAGQGGQQQILVPQQQQLHLVPAGNTTTNNGQLVLAQDNYGNHQPLHVIRIQTQPSPASHPTSQAGGQPQHIIIQPSQIQQSQQASANRQPTTSTSNANRPVPHRFRNLTDEQIARRRKANAERSRRRRAMETADQRAERNRRTAERMRQRRAKIAEERGIVRNESRTTTLSADRFEEIYQSVVQRNLTEAAAKEDPVEMAHMQSMNGPNNNQHQHIIVSAAPHQGPTAGQQVIYRTPQNMPEQYIYQPVQQQGRGPQQLVVQSSVPQQQMSRI
ncbi:hypothetical protein M3Y95_00698800 [Aphelenchoides besseyi]|nr:hypothetical protein M3Y95_00698800 [Aphelenchoides besseyi]